MSKHSQTDVKVNIEIGKSKRIIYIPFESFAKLENFLAKHQINEDPEAKEWEALAKKRIEKYSKVGLVVRGARFREGMSQMQLAKKTGINQNNLSKIENGKRQVGLNVAKNLAKALKIDYHLLIE